MDNIRHELMEIVKNVNTRIDELDYRCQNYGPVFSDSVDFAEMKTELDTLEEVRNRLNDMLRKDFHQQKEQIKAGYKFFAGE